MSKAGTGWFSVDRGLWDHSFFKNEPMSEREAWLWMVANAAWAETTHWVGGQAIAVPRGSFMTTLRDLQSTFMWGSEKRVRTFLSGLENGRMIGRKAVGSANARKTHVTICNYDKFQNDGRTKGGPETHQGRTTDAVKKQTNNKQEAKASMDAQAASALAEVVGQEAADEFVAFRREMKKPVTERSAIAMAKQLENHHDPCAVLQASISNGWQGIFPDKIKPQLKAITGGRNDRSRFDTAHTEYVRRLASGEIDRGPDPSDPFSR